MLLEITEKECSSALNRSGIPGVDYCLNPYTGCSHGCVYCYASFMKRFCGIEKRWGSFVQVKVNFGDKLGRQLMRLKSGCVMLSSVTDPYQPVEEKYGLTRKSLELLADTGFSVSILTKSDLVLRDLDILKAITDIEIGFTITTADSTTADREKARLLEPGAVEPSRRFRALARLAEAGLETWVFIAPVIPGVTDSEMNLARILEEAARAGVRRVEYDPLNFYPTAVANLRYLIQTHWPRSLSQFQAACNDRHTFKNQLSYIAQKLWPAYGFRFGL